MKTDDLRELINEYVWGEETETTVAAEQALTELGIQPEYLDKAIDTIIDELALFFTNDEVQSE